MTDERTAGARPKWADMTVDEREKTWKEMSLEQRREINATATKGTVETYYAEHPEWKLEALTRLLRGALENLRRYLEDEKDPAISWTSPLLELQYDVEWNWETAAPVVAPISDEVLEDFRGMAKWTADRFLKALDFEVMKLYTNGAAVLLKGGETSSLMAPEVQAQVDEMDEEDRDAFFSDFGKPFILGGDFLSDEDLEEWEDQDENGEPVTVSTPKPEALKRLEETEPLIPFKGEVDGAPFSGSLVFAIHPLVVDEDERVVFYPLTVGLQFDPLPTSSVGRVPIGWERSEEDYPNLGKWSPEDRETFWAELFSSLDKLEEIVRDRRPEEAAPQGGTDTKATTSTMEVFRTLDATEVRVVAPSEERTRFLTDSPSRMSKETSLFLGRSPRLTLPRKWAAVPRWDDLVEKEVDRLQGTMGEAAFESRPGSPARLTRHYNARTKEEEVRLTKAGTSDLEDTYGPGCFRRVEVDLDKRRREYLVRILPVEGGGRMEFRTSWYGTAWPLMGDGPDRERQRLEDLKEGVQGELFEDLPAHVQDEVENRLRNLEHIRDAKSLMEHVALKFGGEGRNPVHVTAAELRLALGCEASPDGLARVRGALRSLEEVTFRLELSGGGEPFSLSGRFLSGSVYYPKGPGDHADGDFYLSISPAFIGGLRIFEVRGRKLQDVREITVFDWRTKPTKEERKALAGFSRRQTRLAVVLFTAKGFTESQKALFRFLQENLTRKKAPIQGHRKGRGDLKTSRGAKDAHHHRPYGHEFCPLIPKGTVYAGALGEFLRSPEFGWTLAGTPTAGTATGGGHTGGLLSVMGHPYPSGRAVAVRRDSVKKALEDLRFVVEEVLGGLVAARWEGRWGTIEDAKKLHEAVLSRRVKFFPFLPLDLRSKVKEILDAYNADRFEKGETPYRWEVTAPPEDAGPVLVPEVLETEEENPEGEATGSLEGTALWARLRVARTERKLSQAKVGVLFGVIQQALAAWERGPEAGKPIPPELAPLVHRWVETGTPPTEEELASRRTRRTGVRKPSA